MTAPFEPWRAADDWADVAPRVAVLDYGIGNLRSAEKALAHVGADAVLTSDPAEVERAAAVVLPGVGSFGRCREALAETGLDQVALEAVASGRPFLGICVGMQALMERSEENDGVDCIGLFPGQVRFFGKGMVEDGEQLKVPHMGWNQVQQSIEHPLWHDIPDLARFYFVHS